MPRFGMPGTRTVQLGLAFVTTAVVLALGVGLYEIATNAPIPSNTAQVPGVRAIAAETDTAPTPPFAATATVVPADAMVVVQVDTADAGSQAVVPTTQDAIRLQIGATLVVDPGAGYVLTDLHYDIFFLDPAGQSADGSPRFTAVDFGATYFRAEATPRCRLTATPCDQAVVPVYYLVETGDLRGPKGAVLVKAAQARATALARPTLSPAEAQALEAAEATQEAAIPSPTPCPFPICPGLLGYTVTPAGPGFLVTGTHALYRAGVVNEWMERAADGTKVTVSAGDVAPNGGVLVPVPPLPPTSQQGAVFVQVDNGALNPPPIEIYRTPGRDGALRIISVQGERLTMRAADGTPFVFDLPSRSFIASPGDATATDTPTAISTIETLATIAAGGIPPTPPSEPTVTDTITPVLTTTPASATAIPLSTASTTDTGIQSNLPAPTVVTTSTIATPAP